MTQTSVKVRSSTLSSLDELKKVLGLRTYGEVIQVAVNLLEKLLDTVPPELLTTPGAISYKQLLLRYNDIPDLEKIAEIICNDRELRGKVFDHCADLFYRIGDEKRRCTLALLNKLLHCEDRRDMAILLTLILMDSTDKTSLLQELESRLKKFGLTVKKVKNEHTGKELVLVDWK